MGDRLPMMTRFERLVVIVILANTAMLAVSLFDHDHENFIEASHVGFLTFFGVELVVRLGACGWNPCRFLRESWWNGFDAVVIVLSLLPVIGANLTILRVARAARLLHLLRHVGHLRLATVVAVLRRRGATLPCPAWPNPGVSNPTITSTAVTSVTPDSTTAPL